MASQESRAKKANIKKAILMALKGTAVVSLAIMAPKVLKLLPPSFSRTPSRINRTFYQLRAAGFIEVRQIEGKKVVRLTDKGRAKLERVSTGDKKRPRRWDGRWRVVIYDIGENRKDLRHKARAFVQTYGFERLQDSVWVYPYDCEEVITLLKADLKIGKDILYMIVESIENDAEIRRRFSLPLA